PSSLSLVRWYCEKDLDKADQPKAGEDIKLEGLDTDQPRLTLPNGCTFTGTYEQTIGTDLLLSVNEQTAAPSTLSYLCHTESRIKFLRSTRVPPQGVPRASVSTRDQGHYSSICCSSCGHYFMIGWTDSSRRRRR
ncbi:hypothetical protein WJX84_000200, partial [Apatococcus fuscideae]